MHAARIENSKIQRIKQNYLEAIAYEGGAVKRRPPTQMELDRLSAVLHAGFALARSNEKIPQTNSELHEAMFTSPKKRFTGIFSRARAQKQRDDFIKVRTSVLGAFCASPDFSLGEASDGKMHKDSYEDPEFLAIRGIAASMRQFHATEQALEIDMAKSIDTLRSLQGAIWEGLDPKAGEALALRALQEQLDRETPAVEPDATPIDDVERRLTL